MANVKNTFVNSCMKHPFKEILYILNKCNIILSFVFFSILSLCAGTDFQLHFVMVYFPSHQAYM